MAFDYNIGAYRNRADLRLLANPRHVANWIARVVRVAVLNFIANDDLLWASALTYTVTLSIVPILALAFSVLTGLGLTARLRPMIERYLALGSKQTADALMSLVGHVNAATLGSVGGVALLITVLSTLGTIESAFNMIWQVPSGRSYVRRFTDYVSVVFTIPLLLVAAVTLTASFSVGRDLNLLLSSVLLWIGFFFLFVFFPYTRVRWTAAALGSFISAMLFQLGQWAYIHFWVRMSNYTAIYGALAAIPVLLLWIYVAWLIVLFGVEISFAVQRGTTRYESEPHSLNFIRYAVLLTMLRLAERHRDKRQTVTPESLASELRVAITEVVPILTGLKKHGLIVESAGDNASAPGLFLGLDPTEIKLGDTMRALAIDRTGDRRVTDLLCRLHEIELAHLDSITVRDLQDGGDGLLTKLAEPPPREQLGDDAAIRGTTAG